MLTEKQCTRCDQIKPLSEFHKQKSKKSGYKSHCKHCIRIYAQQRYLDHKERISLLKKQYYQDNRALAHLYQKEKREANKEQMQAQGILNYAILKGEIVKPEFCCNCLKKADLDAHHEDYSKALEVLWLCRDCHMKHHTKSKVA